MIVLHNLAHSRGIRVAWLLEEMGVDYEVVPYARTGAYRAPEALRAVHPLAKSPVLVDGDLVLVESAAILRHLDARHGGGFCPDPGTEEGARHAEWLDYAEGTLAPLVSAVFWHAKEGRDVTSRQADDLKRHLGWVDGRIAGPWLTGERLTLADMQLCYQAAMAEFGQVLGDYPAFAAWWERVQGRPAFGRAVERTGAVMPG